MFRIDQLDPELLEKFIGDKFTTPEAVIGTPHGPKVGDSLANLLLCIPCLPVGACDIQFSRPDGDGNVLDRLEVVLWSVYFSLLVVWGILLETILDGILSPVDVSLEGHRLTSRGRISIVAHFLAEVRADRFPIVCPVGASEDVDAIFMEMEKTLFIERVTLTHINGAGVDRREREKVVLQEFFF